MLIAEIKLELNCRWRSSGSARLSSIRITRKRGGPHLRSTPLGALLLLTSASSASHWKRAGINLEIGPLFSFYFALLFLLLGMALHFALFFSVFVLFHGFALWVLFLLGHCTLLVTMVPENESMTISFQPHWLRDASHCTTAAPVRLHAKRRPICAGLPGALLIAARQL